MALKVVSEESIKERRRERERIEEKVPFINVKGEMKYVKKVIAHGEMEVYSLAKPVGEMITTDDGMEDVQRKVVIDVEVGREDVPLLYQPVYRRIEDRNFPKHIDTNFLTESQAVFLQHVDGEEVKFGARSFTPGSTVPILTWAAGFEWSEDLEEYDRTWEMEEFNTAFGRAYNALLNHIHFNPIISYAYGAENQTAAQSVGDGSNYILNLRETIKQGLKDARVAKRSPSVLLAASVHQEDIEEALARLMIDATTYQPLSGIDTLIFYDGWEVTVGEKTYTYPGVPNDKSYLIRPRERFVELVKHGLITDSTGADLSRLVSGQMVGRTRRGAYTSPADAVQELTMP